jgi:hypothetical protein
MFNGTPAQIFLSYAREDKAQVEKVYRRLKQEGHKPWLDTFDLLPGQRWEREIPNALRASDFILVLFSSISISKRGYVQKEFKLALEVLDEIPEDRICVIPVRLDNCSVPGRFSQLQVCDLNDFGGLDRLLHSIDLELQMQARKHGRVAPVQSGFFKRVLTLWSGHTVAALGARAVGKSTLLNILTTGSMPQDPKQTELPEKVPGSLYRVGELEVKLSPTLDVSGSEEAYFDWETLVTTADIVFYLAFADRLIHNNPQTVQRVKQDADVINRWLAQSRKLQRIAIVGTHADLDQRFWNLGEDTFSGYLDDFRRIPAVEYMVERLRGAARTPVVVGSFVNAKEAERLLCSLFSRIL